MSTRVFTICTSEPAGAPAGLRSSVTQVSLTLYDDNRFSLVWGSYYSDWGSRRQDSSTFAGTYEECETALRCQSATVRNISFSSDHDWGTRNLEDQSESSSDIFCF